VAEPKKRDNVNRPPCIPEAVLKKRMQKMQLSTENMDDEDNEEESMDTDVKYFRNSKKKTERDIELEEGDDYVLDLNKKFDWPTMNGNTTPSRRSGTATTWLTSSTRTF